MTYVTATDRTVLTYWWPIYWPLTGYTAAREPFYHFLRFFVLGLCAVNCKVWNLQTATENSGRDSASLCCYLWHSMTAYAIFNFFFKCSASSRSMDARYPARIFRELPYFSPISHFPEQSQPWGKIWRISLGQYSYGHHATMRNHRVCCTYIAWKTRYFGSHHHRHHIRLLNFVRTQSNTMRDIETIQTNTGLYKSYG